MNSRGRLAGAVVAATLAMSGLAACTSPSPAPGGNSTTADEPVTLTMTIWGSDIDHEVMKSRLALAKEAYPTITVDLTLVPNSGNETYDTKLQTMFAGNTAPDILQMAEAVNVYSSKGQLEDLTSYMEELDVDPVATFGQGAVDTYSTDGKLWGIPDRSGMAVVYFNKDLFDAAGQEYPSAEWSWQDFRDAALAVTQRDGDNVTAWGFAGGDWWPYYMTWMYQNGGSVLDATGKPVANSAENIEAIDFYNNLIQVDKVAPSPADYADAGIQNGSPSTLFAQGKLAMMFSGFWDVASNAESEFNWDIAPMWHGKVAMAPAFGSALCVSSSSQNKEAAATIVAFLTSAVGQKPVAEAAQDVPANLEAASDVSFLEPSWNTRNVDLSVFSAPEVEIYAPPLIPEWNEITRAYTDGLADTWAGTQSVKDGLDMVQATLEGLLG
jgi:multiple sugar transport system substrate-binding protein